MQLCRKQELSEKRYDFRYIFLQCITWILILKAKGFIIIAVSSARSGLSVVCPLSE